MKKLSIIQNELKNISLYSIISLIFIFALAIYNIYYANKMHQIANTIYEHPLKVSNAALSVRIDVVRIHRDMKDVVLSTSNDELIELIHNIDKIESRVITNLNIIEQNILGDEGLVLQKQTKDLFIAWRVIREEVINLVKRQSLEIAIGITKNKGAKHVEKVESHTLMLYQYAKNKADMFKDQSYSALIQFEKLNTFITASFILFFAAMVFYIMQRIKLFIKKTEESEHRFELLYDKAPLPYQSLDFNGNILSINDKWAQELGYTKEEIIGKNFSFFLTPSYKKKFKERFPKFKSLGETHGVEFEMLKKDGEAIVVSFNGKIVKDDNGEFLQTHCIFTNITEKKKDQEALVKSEANFRALSENIDDIFFITEPYLQNHLYVSPAYEKIFGRPVDELKEKPDIFLNSIHPDDRASFIQIGIASLENNSPFEIEYRIYRKDGEMRWIHEHGLTVTNHPGYDKLMVGACRDITDKKRIQEELYLANILIESSETILFRWKAQKGWPMEYVSKNIQQLGFSAQELLSGKLNYADLIHKDDLERVENEVYEYLRLGIDAFHIEYRIVSPSGLIYWVEERSVVEHNTDGKVEYFQGTISDITNRKETEKEKELFISRLKEQKELIDRQSINAKIGYWTIDVDTNNIIWSSEVLKIYGLKKEPKHNNIFTLKQSVHPDDIDKLVASLEKVKTSPNYKHDMTYRIEVDGAIKWVQCQGKLNEEDNKVEGTLQDITELITTKFELEKQKQLLLSQSKAAMMGEMISLIAHQWKQPLTILSMAGNNMRVDVDLDTIDNNTIKETANEIDKQVQHLSNTIDTFKDFLKPNEGKKDIKVESAINSSLGIVNKSLVNNEIELIKEFDPRLELHINPSELMQVIINLINNAKDAFKINNIQNRKLWLRTFEKNNNITIEIEDTAGGIDENKINKIFDAYYTTKSKFGGTGLGLYIVRTIITEHFNGSIEVKNTKEGVKFNIVLPK